MIRANKKAQFNCDIKKVFGAVTNNADYSWRSDLSKIEILEEGKVFVEYTKNGFPTTFKITKTEPFKRYEFDMKNQNMSGHWTGIFTQIPSGTQIDFTEEVTVKNPIMKLLAGIYLKKQQKTYVHDLEIFLKAGGRCRMNL